MYKWPQEIRASRFEGMRVESILFTDNTISITFDNAIQIIVESAIEFTTNNLPEIIEFPLSQTRLVSLIGKSVQSAYLEPDSANLILCFGRENVLKISGEDPCFECYHIRINDFEFTI